MRAPDRSLLEYKEDLQRSIIAEQLQCLLPSGCALTLGSLKPKGKLPGSLEICSHCDLPVGVPTSKKAYSESLPELLHLSDSCKIDDKSHQEFPFLPTESEVFEEPMSPVLEYRGS